MRIRKTEVTSPTTPPVVDETPFIAVERFGSDLKDLPKIRVKSKSVVYFWSILSNNACVGVDVYKSNGI